MLSEKVGTAVLSMVVQRLGHEFDHLLPFGAEFENEWSYICFCPPCNLSWHGKELLVFF